MVEEANSEIKKTNLPKRLFKLLFRALIAVGFLFTTLFILLFIYEDEVKATVIGELNKNLKSEVIVNPENIDLTFISSFPRCAVEFKNVLIKEATDKKDRDTLIFSNSISLQFDLKDLWNKNYTIRKIKIKNSLFYISLDKKGKPNYIFWETKTKNQAGNLKFKLDNIALSDLKLRYKNAQTRVKTEIYFHNSSFAGNFSEEAFRLSTKGLAKLNYFIINKNNLISEKEINYDLEFQIEGSNYLISKAEIAINRMNFLISGKLVYGDSLSDANLSFEGNNLNLAAIMSLLPESQAQRISEYESKGVFYSKGHLTVKQGKLIELRSEFGISDAQVIHKSSGSKLEHLNISGILINNESESFLNLQNFSAELGKNHMNGFALLSNLKDPFLISTLAIESDLEELNKFWPLDTLQSISGQLNLKVNLKGKWSELKKSAFSNDVTVNGTAMINDVKAKFKGVKSELTILEGTLELLNRNVKLNNFKILYGNSDLEFNGEAPGLVNYLLNTKENLTVNASLVSNKIFVEDLIFSSQGSLNSAEVSLPSNLNFKLNADIGYLSFAKFEAQNLIGNIIIHHQKLIANDIVLSTMEGKALMSASADLSSNVIEIKVASECKNINISKLFYQTNSFGQELLNESHLSGFATSTINFTGIWSKKLEPNLESITANGNLQIDQGRLLNFKPLLSLSKYVELNELKDIRFQALESNFEIRNQVISIPKTSIKNSALNIEFWGKHTFKNEIDYHVQLLLTDLIANKKRVNKELDDELTYVENDPENRRSVFILMTGTIDNPIIKYDRKGLRQKIKEDIKTERQNLKQLLKEEFGLFKNDTTIREAQLKKGDQPFKIEFGDKKETKSKTLQPKKKEEEDDDF